MDPANILILSSGFFAVMSLLAVPFKTRIVSYSYRSMQRKDLPKFEIRKDRVFVFILISLNVFLLNVMYCLILTREVGEMGAVAGYSLVNTAFICYTLSYWILLKEKKKESTQDL